MPSSVSRSFHGFVCTLLLSLLSGCYRTHVHADVFYPAGPTAKPLADASVSMTCPQVFKGEGLSLLGRTDKNGVLEFEEPAGGRWIHDDCDLVVHRSGFKPQRFPVASVCKEYSGNHCIRAKLTATMQWSK